MRVRGMLLGTLLLCGCAHNGDEKADTPYPRIEVRLDEGRAAEKPLTPQKTFEILMKMDPGLGGYTPRKFRFLLAQAGKITFTLYQAGADGGPGAAIGTIEHDYDGAFVSDGKDGRWVTEKLINYPIQHGTLWLGIHAPAGGDPRLWATSNRSEAYQRDPDPSAALSNLKIPRTPMVRLEVVPAS